VIDAVFHVLLYAIVAAASPLVLTATFLVVRGESPRSNGIAFLVGFLFGTAVACILGLVVGQATIEKLDSRQTIEDLLTLALGVVILGFGLRARGREPAPAAERSSRAAAIMASLRHVRPAAAFSMAGLLGFGGPKRLLLTLLAMAVVNGAQQGHVANLALTALYIAVATVLVWVPVGMVVIAGERAAVILGESESWMTEHARELRIWLCLAFGAALIADGLVRQFL
jgi:cytochrome c biogenesis protein CcdA